MIHIISRSNYLHVTSHNNDTRHRHNMTITSNYNNNNNSTTTTNGRNRDGRGGTWAQDRHVSSLTGMFFFFSCFFYNYTNLIVAIRVHPPPINLDVQPPMTLRLPCHHPTTHDTTTPPAHQGRRTAQKGPTRRV